PGPREAAPAAGAARRFRRCGPAVADAAPGAHMISHHQQGSDEPMVPASWLARARAQSMELAEARARQHRPLRREVLRQTPTHRLLSRHLFALVMASALVLLLVASGAWALAIRVKRESSKSLPPPAVTVPGTAPVEVHRGVSAKPAVSTAPAGST